jgi:hypothetical protein
VDEAYLLVWEGPDLLEGSETNEIAHGAPAQIYPSAGNRGLRHQEQPSQFHSTLAPLPLHPTLRRSDGTPTGKIAILGWRDGDEGLCAAAARAIAVLYVRPGTRTHL